MCLIKLAARRDYFLCISCKVGGDSAYVSGYAVMYLSCFSFGLTGSFYDLQKDLR